MSFMGGSLPIPQADATCVPNSRRKKRLRNRLRRRASRGQAGAAKAWRASLVGASRPCAA